ncbi:MAG: glycoside hydrolase domain-containing protein [Actinomycetes bacterium]
MQSLWDSVPDLTFVCLYFAPAPSHPNRAWMDAASSLRSMGWGLVPTYVGQQVIGVGSHVVTADQGKIDAQGAAALAGNAGLDAGSVIYLDIENGGLMPANQVAYVTSWIGEVNANTDHWAGVYCSHFKTAKQVADAAGVTDHDVATWAYRPIDSGPSVIDLGAEQPRDPAGSGYAPAIVWQYRMSLNGSVDLTWTDQATGASKRLNQVDLDTASVQDPSNPDAPAQVQRSAARGSVPAIRQQPRLTMLRTAMRHFRRMGR